MKHFVILLLLFGVSNIGTEAFAQTQIGNSLGGQEFQEIIGENPRDLGIASSLEEGLGENCDSLEGRNKTVCLCEKQEKSTVTEGATDDPALQCTRDLHYTLTLEDANQKMADDKVVCTPCPLNNYYYSCVERGGPNVNISDYYTVTTPSFAEYDKTCVAFPDCKALGYRLSLTTVKQKIPQYYKNPNTGNIIYKYFCSACPLDGNVWACVKSADSAHLSLNKLVNPQ